MKADHRLFAILVWENTAGNDKDEEDETLTFDDDTEGNAESKSQSWFFVRLNDNHHAHRMK